MALLVGPHCTSAGACTCLVKDGGRKHDERVQWVAPSGVEPLSKVLDDDWPHLGDRHLLLVPLTVDLSQLEPKSLHGAGLLQPQLDNRCFL